MYPSTITTFSYPTPSDRLNNPSHSGLENTQSSAIGQIQTFIGLAPSSAIGTLIYDIRSSDSNGGGHVQTANKGGTGQTSFNKGDILVAQSSSVLAKVAASSVTGYVLTIDTNEATGVKWAPTVANKVNIGTTSVIVSGTSEQVLYSASIIGGSLGTNNAIKFTGVVQRFGSQDAFTWALKYGGGMVASITTANTENSSVLVGTIEGGLLGNGGTSSQLGYFKVDLQNRRINNVGSPTFFTYTQGTSSVNSSVDQPLTITGFYSGTTGASSSITSGLFIVEKIS